MAALTKSVGLAEELARIPEGHWVAFASDGSFIVFSAASVDEAIAGAAKKGTADPVLYKNVLGLLII